MGGGAEGGSELQLMGERGERRWVISVYHYSSLLSLQLNLFRIFLFVQLSKNHGIVFPLDICVIQCVFPDKPAQSKCSPVQLSGGIGRIVVGNAESPATLSRVSVRSSASTPSPQPISSWCPLHG